MATLIIPTGSGSSEVVIGGSNDHSKLKKLDFASSGHTGFQSELTFDEAPTQDSTNPVTSHGIYAALSHLQDGIQRVESNTDLDDVTTPGVYFFEDAHSGRGVGLLYVITGQAQDVYQTVSGELGEEITGIAPQRFTTYSRSYQSGEWSDWAEVTDDYSEVEIGDTVTVSLDDEEHPHKTFFCISIPTSITFEASGSVNGNLMLNLKFKTGNSAPSILYDENNTFIITWMGTDCSMDGTKSVFSPKSNTSYDIIFSANSDNSGYIGIVNGYVPALSN